MISLAPVLGFSVLGIPSGDTQNTSDLGTGVPKTRGYPNHCDTGISLPFASWGVMGTKIFSGLDSRYVAIGRCKSWVGNEQNRDKLGLARKTDMNCLEMKPKKAPRGCADRPYLAWVVCCPISKHEDTLEKSCFQIFK